MPDGGSSRSVWDPAGRGRDHCSQDGRRVIGGRAWEEEAIYMGGEPGEGDPLTAGWTVATGPLVGSIRAARLSTSGHPTPTQ